MRPAGKSIPPPTMLPNAILGSGAVSSVLGAATSRSAAEASIGSTQGARSDTAVASQNPYALTIQALRRRAEVTRERELQRCASVWQHESLRTLQGAVAKGDCDEIIRALTRKNNWDRELRLALSSRAYEAVQRCLPLWIEQERFEERHVEMLITYSAPYGGDSSDVHMILCQYLPLLINRGLLTRDHVRQLFRNVSADDVSGAHLPALIAAGLVDRAHVQDLCTARYGSRPEFVARHLDLFCESNLFDAAILAEAADEHGMLALRSFMGDALPVLDVRGLLTQELYDHVINALDHREGWARRDAVRVITQWLDRFLEKGWFGVSDYRKVEACHHGQDGDVKHASLQFYIQQLPTLLREGLLDVTEGRRLLFDFLISLWGIDVFTEHLPLLMEHGLFSECDYWTLSAVVANNMSHSNSSAEDEPWKKAIRFFDRQLPQLVACGFLKRHHLGCLVTHSHVQNASNVIKAIDGLIAKHYGLLRAHGFFTEDELEELETFNETERQSWIRDHRQELGYALSHGLQRSTIDLQAHYHILKKQGAMDGLTLATILGHAHRSLDEIHYLSVLGQDATWLASPQRWQALIGLVDEIADPRFDKDAAFYQLLAQLECSPPLEDVVGFVSALTQIGQDAEHLISWMQDRNARTHDIESIWAMLESTELLLGLQGHPAVVALRRAREEHHTDTLALEYALSDMPLVWEKYQRAYREAERVHDSKSQQKIKRKVINWLEAQQGRVGTLSYVRLLAQAAEKIATREFERRLLGTEAGDVAAMSRLLQGQVWSRFQATKFYRMCRKLSGFITPMGMASLRRFLLGLHVEGNRLTYPRYEELRGVIASDVLAAWEREYQVQIELAQNKQSVPALKAQLLQQAVQQVVAHKAVSGIDPAKIPEELRSLSQEVELWCTYAQSASVRGEEGLAQAHKLLKVFESSYTTIRKAFGDTFANIYVDLRNLVRGYDSGVKVAKRSEVFQVSGDPETIARSGSEPVYTCQTFEFRWVNEEGQPIHRLMHGQFKVANWIMDDVVTARSLIEMTVDDEGREHLLIERPYMASGFGQMKAFRAQIVGYAQSIGIDAERVHFSDDTRKAPAPLGCGDLVYRDTFREEGRTLNEVREQRVSKVPLKKPSTARRPRENVSYSSAS